MHLYVYFWPCWRKKSPGVLCNRAQRMRVNQKRRRSTPAPVTLLRVKPNPSQRVTTTSSLHTGEDKNLCVFVCVQEWYNSACNSLYLFTLECSGTHMKNQASHLWWSKFKLRKTKQICLFNLFNLATWFHLGREKLIWCDIWLWDLCGCVFFEC